MSKRKSKHLPTYAYERTEYKGVRERLALASLAFSKTWKTTTKEHGLKLGLGNYMHSVRYISKTEGWEARLTWTDNLNHVNIDGVKAYIAHGIEGARAMWYEDQKPGKTLQAIAANMKAKVA